jgi:hypothetical protein
MIAGALATAAAVALFVVTVRRTSKIEVAVARITRSRADHRSRLDPELALRGAGAIAGALVGCVIGFALNIGVLPVPVSAFVGSAVVSAWRERRDAARRAEAERSLVTIVEWLHALVLSGRPLESAVARAVTVGSGSAYLDGALRQAHRDYALGVPMHHALARAGAECGVRGLASLADRIARARAMGRAALPMLDDLRDELRAAERARLLDSASQVDGKLTLVLTLCYLPALALLVMIPLFLTLLAGLFG